MNRFLIKASKSFRRGEKGFTLVELLIVIAIIAILAAIIIPNVARVIREGRIAAARAERAELQVGIDAAMASVGANQLDANEVVSPSDFSINTNLAAPNDVVDVEEWLVRTENVKGTWTVSVNGTIVACTIYPGLDLYLDDIME